MIEKFAELQAPTEEGNTRMQSLSLVSAALAGTFLGNCNRIGLLSLERIDGALLILPSRGNRYRQKTYVDQEGQTQ